MFQKAFGRVRPHQYNTYGENFNTMHQFVALSISATGGIRPSLKVILLDSRVAVVASDLIRGVEFSEF